MADIRNQLGVIAKTGKVVLGEKETAKALLSGNPKLIVLSSFAKNHTKDRFGYYAKLAGVGSVVVEANSMELGSLCGKPYPVSVLAVLDAGEAVIAGG
jgi:large subunit ribosomal protein L30e